jgi:hypothetical protein
METIIKINEKLIYYCYYYYYYYYYYVIQFTVQMNHCHYLDLSFCVHFSSVCALIL